MGEINQTNEMNGNNQSGNVVLQDLTPSPLLFSKVVKLHLNQGPLSWSREPRNFARTVNLKVIGTIGVIRFAWMKGLIKEPIHEINKLLLNGFWIGEKLIEQIKKDIK